MRARPRLARFRVLLPAVWLGILLSIALIATPAPFATLAVDDAGRVVRRIFSQEAYLSLAFAVVLFAMERGVARDDAEAGRSSVFSANLILLLGTLFCTVAGYFAVIPLMEAARAGQGSVPFGLLHLVSTGFFGLKALLVAALAWRVTCAPAV